MRRVLNLKKHLKSARGFTLIEMALALVLIGLVAAPAAMMYTQQRAEKDWEETEVNMDHVTDALGGYRSVYGRYPCPAPSDAAPGDALYGHEDCTTNPALNSCASGICRYSSNIAGRTVLVGSLPFKTLNLNENDAYDQYLNRLEYAVTAQLVDNTTFSLDGGGIGLNDLNGDSIIKPDDTAHFVVLSAGRNKIGATARNGATSAPCAGGSVIEQENCDGDSVYTSAEIAPDYDDRTLFFSSVSMSEWQYVTGSEDVQLKNTDSVALGASMAQNLNDGETLSVLKTTPSSTNTGFVKAEDSVFTDRLCEDNGAATNVNDCFEPELIAGSLGSGPLKEVTTAGHGISCYDPGNGVNGFLSGIQNKRAECTDEVFVTCPSGQSIQRIHSNGRIQCAGQPPNPCLEATLPKTCGGDHTLTNASPSGTPNGTLRTAFSGECRKITNYNYSYFQTNTAGMTTLAEFQSLIATLNSEPRTTEACNTVRDTYRCNSGTWQHYRAHEKGWYWQNFTSNLHNNGSYWRAETSSSNHLHNDCECEEQYRVQRSNCPSGQAGYRYSIQKLRCPQTHYSSYYSWHTIYTNSENCGCADYIDNDIISCVDYYNRENGTTIPANSLSGNVTERFHVRCVNDNHVKDPTPFDTQGVAACSCPTRARNVDRTACPVGETNSWSWAGGNETAVQALTSEEWVCPATKTGGINDPGYYAPPVAHSPIPACTCDTSIVPDTRSKTCDEVYPGENLQGPGVFYEVEWDCALGDWEAEEDWSETSSQCYTCAWKQPAGAGTSQDDAFGGLSKKVGKPCTCGSAPSSFCWNYGDDEKFDVWTNCACAVDIP